MSELVRMVLLFTETQEASLYVQFGIKKGSTFGKCVGPHLSSLVL
jgi:hypothetical protein